MEKKSKPKTTIVVKLLKGSFKMPENFDYKEELKKVLEEKYK